MRIMYGNIFNNNLNFNAYKPEGPKFVFVLFQDIVFFMERLEHTHLH